MIRPPRLTPKALPTPVAAACAALLAAGCAATATPDYDARFGDATRILAAGQTADPGAPARNGDRRAATDGRTMREAVDRHTDTFRMPPPTNVINIGVGAGGNGR